MLFINNKKKITKLIIIFVILLPISFVVKDIFASTNSWTFTTSSNYIFDSSVIEFSSGVAQIKETDSPIWYDTAWGKRKVVSIDNTDNVNILTDYQIKVIIPYDSDMQVDFDDIRFINSDGLTLMDYWLETKIDSNSATFWVKIPSISSSSSKDIYMYYGNAGVGSISSGDNTFLFFDDFDDISSYLTFGSGTWSVVVDAERGNVLDVDVIDSDTGIYKSNTNQEYVAEIFVKETHATKGSWGGLLINMEDTNNWYRSGKTSVSGNGALQFRENNNGIFTNYDNDGADTSKNTWYKEKIIYKTANYFDVSTIWTSKIAHQGLATDGTYVYSTNHTTLAKYDMDGTLILSTTDRPAGVSGTFGGMKYHNGYVYAIVFNHPGPPQRTYIVRYDVTDFSQNELVKEITSDIGYGGNALAHKDGYWIVGETGGYRVDYNQHFYVFNDDWILQKTIQSPYYLDFGAQDATFKDNLLYVTQHDKYLLVFLWDENQLSLTLVDAMRSGPGYEGIAWDDINSRFYVDASADSTILFGTFPDNSEKRAIYYIESSSASHGVVSHDFSPNTQTYLGIGSYRNERFDSLFLRSYVAEEPFISLGSERSLYSSINPTIQSNSANSLIFDSLSSFSTISNTNGGDIKYILSNDGGVTWNYYNLAWIISDGTYSQSNTEAEVDTNISAFPVGDGNFLFKAFLDSDGTHTVELDQISIDYILSSSSSGSSGSGTRYVCKDINASNYSIFGRHRESFCVYDDLEIEDINLFSYGVCSAEDKIDNLKESICTEDVNLELNPFNGEECSSELIVYNNMKYGDINGTYSSYNKGIITEISILQAHINRLLEEDYGHQAAGPIDDYFGLQTKLGVERLQKKLNELLPGMKPLIIDGIVGPFTRGAVNMSC